MYFGALIAVSLLIGWAPLAETFALAWRNDAYTHILLILPVSIFMIISEMRLLQAKHAPVLRTGSAIVLFAIGLAGCAWLWSSALSADLQLAIRMFALISSWLGAFLLCFGVFPARKLIFPLLFLFGLAPLPSIVMSILVSLLQIGSAWFAHLLFTAFGVPTFQQGVMLTIPGLTIQVAQECSSIRSSSMLFVTTLVIAQLFLRSIWRKTLVVCLSFPLSIIKNGLRIFVIAILGTRVDQGFLNGKLHHQGGFIYFAFALACIALILWILRKTENNPIHEANDSERPG